MLVNKVNKLESWWCLVSLLFCLMLMSLMIFSLSDFLSYDERSWFQMSVWFGGESSPDEERGRGKGRWAREWEADDDEGESLTFLSFSLSSLVGKAKRGGEMKIEVKKERADQVDEERCDEFVSWTSMWGEKEEEKKEIEKKSFFSFYFFPATVRKEIQGREGNCERTKYLYWYFLAPFFLFFPVRVRRKEREGILHLHSLFPFVLERRQIIIMEGANNFNTTTSSKEKLPTQRWRGWEMGMEWEERWRWRERERRGENANHDGPDDWEGKRDDGMFVSDHKWTCTLRRRFILDHWFTIQFCDFR